MVVGFVLLAIPSDCPVPEPVVLFLRPHRVKFMLRYGLLKSVQVMFVVLLYGLLVSGFSFVLGESDILENKIILK